MQRRCSVGMTPPVPDAIGQVRSNDFESIQRAKGPMSHGF